MPDTPILDDQASYSDALRADRHYAKTIAGQQNAKGPRLRVALGGNGNMDFMIPGLRQGLRRYGMASDLVSTGYAGWVGEALSEAHNVDAWLIWHSALGASRGGTERPDTEVDHIGAAIRKILDSGQQVLFFLPEALSAEADPFSPFVEWRRQLLIRLHAVIPPKAIVTSIEHVQRRMGENRWYAPRYWSTAKAPAHPDAVTQVGLEASTILAQAIKRRVKAVVVDLDNTLWGGIVGDDGPENLQLDPDGLGRPFLALQRLLLDISASGVPLCVASKNAPEQALRPFEERPEMLLKRSDIVYFEASWNAKHIAIARIAEQLNIGLDTIFFLDDSPHERSEARTFLPNLIIPELPADPEERVRMLYRTGLFQTPVLLADDKHRVQRYKEDSQRKTAAATATSLDDYLRSLHITLRIREITDKTLPRAASLVQRTNQFNLSGRRHSATVVQAFGTRDDGFAFGIEAVDRFGDIGMISVILGTKAEATLHIDTWVLSCRAFGRTIEHGIFAVLQDKAGAWGLTSIAAEYVETPRNGPVATFFANIGAQGEMVGESRLYSCPVSPRVKHFVETLAFDKD